MKPQSDVILQAGRHVHLPNQTGATSQITTNTILCSLGINANVFTVIHEMHCWNKTVTLLSITNTICILAI